MMYDNRSTETLIAEIKDLEGDLAGNMYEICLRLAALDKRHFRHVLFGHPLYCHFRVIAAKRILPQIVFGLNGDKFKVDRLLDIPEQVQQNIAAGNLFTVAHYDRKAEAVVEKELSVFDMPRDTFARFFPGGGKRATFSEQKSALETELTNKAARVEEIRKNAPKIQVNTVRKTIRVPGETATLEQIVEALRRFGLTVVEEKANAA